MGQIIIPHVPDVGRHYVAILERQYTVTTRNHKRVTIHRKKDMSHIPERKEQSQSPNTNVNLPLRTGQSISKEIQDDSPMSHSPETTEEGTSSEAQNNIKEPTSALQICTDLLQELGTTKEKLQATETRLKALETSQQELMSRLANSEAQIEKIKMENKG
ncbi:HP-25 -like protein [Labeo rohita]|uniref:HP-25-like protein n=1 Tax=Labeo rohita TaxID=84645 RepID=A0A498MKK1_LABRO|nr:HP-25 -like protein [Labeo rohita]